MARTCAWCGGAVIIEAVLYATYRGHDASFHWFTHFFVGSAAALAIMTVVALRIRRPVPVPLVWLLLGHLYAMFPDFLFDAGVAHQPWMDMFLGHVTSHFVPGANLTWLVVFLIAAAVYLAAVDRVTDG